MPHDATRDLVFGSGDLTAEARDALQFSQMGYQSLVPDGPNTEARPLMDAVERAGAVVSPQDQQAADCVRSALWLWHDYLDECHAICQNIDTAEGSYLHGMMHRREGDFSNAKYWFRQAGKLPSAIAMTAEVQEAIRDEPAEKLVVALTLRGWDPMAFVDLCEACHDHAEEPRYAVAIAVQKIEWRLLVDGCIRTALR